MNHLAGFILEQEDNMFSNTFKVINNIRTSKNTLGYWDDWNTAHTIHNLPYPLYEHRRTAFRHVYSASPARVVELMDEIDALKAQIENLGGVSLAEVKTNEA